MNDKDQTIIWLLNKLREQETINEQLIDENIELGQKLKANAELIANLETDNQYLETQIEVIKQEYGKS